MAIIQLVEALFKYFFDTHELYEDTYSYQMNTRYMELFADYSLELFNT